MWSWGKKGSGRRRETCEAQVCLLSNSELLKWVSLESKFFLRLLPGFLEQGETKTAVR